MTDEVPESDEILQHALQDPGLQGWHETSGDPVFEGKTYWWIKLDDLYLGVLPQGWSDGNDYPWFVSQGRNGDPDNDPRRIAIGRRDTPEAAREAATMWYNRNRSKIKPRR